jgi:hypothetical protein
MMPVELAELKIQLRLPRQRLYPPKYISLGMSSIIYGEENKKLHLCVDY